nr:MAG TPA: hypothetical protein [Caudoviricetes sp.]
MIGRKLLEICAKLAMKVTMICCLWIYWYQYTAILNENGDQQGKEVR